VELLGILDSALMLLLLALVVVCGTTDVLYQKIWDVVTMPAALLGVLLNVAAAAAEPQLGLQHLLSSVAGLAVGFGIFFVLFLLGGMGGGDVKYVAAIGAIDPFHFGHWFILQVILYSVFAGGAIAILMMAARGQLLRSFRNVFRTAYTFVMPGLQHEPLKPENSQTMPFGFAISLGTLWTLVLFLAGLLP
jgi:prepilin peptidase CpaA